MAVPGPLSSPPGAHSAPTAPRGLPSRPPSALLFLARPPVGEDRVHGVERVEEEEEGRVALAVQVASEARGPPEDRGLRAAVARGARGPVLGGHLASGLVFGLPVPHLPPRLRQLQSPLPSQVLSSQALHSAFKLSRRQPVLAATLRPRL